MIQAPYTIAKLPNGPFPDESHHSFAEVQSIVGTGKRKRSELAVATDNSCINLYDVLNSRPHNASWK